MGHTSKNGQSSKKVSNSEIWVTLGKCRYHWKNVSYMKKGPHLKISVKQRVNLGNKSHTWIMAHTLNRGSHLEKWVSLALGKKGHA